jgi:hypothetical protein
MKLVLREQQTEELNRKVRHIFPVKSQQAIRLAKSAAKETGALVAGDICNSNVWNGKKVLPFPLKIS